MASEVLTERPLASTGATEVNGDTVAQSRPTSILEVEEHRDNEDNTVYPTGPKLWSTMASMAIACFLSGLDLTIVTVAVPSITDEFQTITDIGWYSAAYGMTLSAFVFFFGQIYTLFSIKAVFLIGIATFEIGSLICTLAPSSAIFILGRAVSGLGRGAINGGLFKLLRQCFPLSKQAITNSFFGSIQSVGLITAPTIGGALIDAFSWRACFGVNLPLGVMCLVLTAYGVHEQPPRRDTPVLTLKEKVKKVDFFGTLLAVPAITFLLMALQWGGTKFGWGTWQIIVPLVVCALLFVAFGYLQYRQGDNALLPPRILKQRSIIAGMWYGVRGYSPTKAGLLALPMVGGLAIAFIISGVGTTWIGYYYPFMLATSVLTPIASGLLTTLDLEEQIAKAVGLLTFLGLAVGLGLQGPQVALQAVLPIEDVSLGGAVISFGAGMGSALWICASATLFQDRLSKEIQDAAPGTNTTHIQEAGLSKLRESIGPDRLKSVLSGYETAVVQTLPIRAAPAKEGAAQPMTLVERAISKRSGISKSACWECRKRKAKCNGQKPVCVNCSKHDRPCVYDSDIRESRVRGLQQANQKLQDELAAAKLLMRQMASGSAQLRRTVSELLEEEKQPSEIAKLLKNDERADDKMDEADSGRLLSTLCDPILRDVANGTSHSFPVDDFESFSADSSSMRQEESSPDSDSCVAMESTAANPYTANHSTISTPNYTSTEVFTDYTQPNTPSLVDTTESIPPYPSQVSYSHSAIISTNNSQLDELPTVTHQHDYESRIAHQTEHASLFFQPLFNHNDYYLSTSITTPVLQETQAIDSTTLGVPNEYPESTHDNFTTELSSPAEGKLQDTALRIYPNYENNFGNLALSNSIRANGYPRHIQDAQIRNIFVPSWAATTLNTELDPGNMSNAFGDIYQKATGLLKKGEPANRVIGDHPNIAALYDQDQFDRSVINKPYKRLWWKLMIGLGYDFTCFASMNVFWYMMRWMINPSPETYAAMPEWIRPTANQLFTPHISMADFVLWPAFRDLVVQFPQLQERMAWLADMSMYIRCEWPYALEDALKPDPINGTVDLVDLAKIAQISSNSLARGQASMPIRGGSFSTNQPPDAIRQLIRRWLTDKEADTILSRFQEACIPNRQVFWSGMFREQAQKWADAHELQTLTTALGPLLYRGDPSPQTQAPASYIHGASIIFAWFVSQGDSVTVLSHPPPLFFHPSGQTFYQLYEEPIIKGNMGNRPVGRIDTAHPFIETAIDFIYQIWPYDNSSLWKKTFGNQDIDLPWRQTKTHKPTAQSGAQTKNNIVKGEQVKKNKKRRRNKKEPIGLAKQGNNPTTKKSPASGTSSSKRPSAKTAVISKKQNVESGIKMKAKKKKKKKKKKQKVAAVEKSQAQPNAKQCQKEPAITTKTKVSKKGAKAKVTMKSETKNGK
ncbi:major facilitator superfamily transporter [Fusarium phyllophilum]|uniref:Major facilitator superfamily transporter n=1 Tax=Fusarium phyllophilum TaxID=47803 RepID=A0A8H5IX16_9HYPO|nr:major facilitator superfamily transporter [Fusarium phyllophilum]